MLSSDMSAEADAPHDEQESPAGRASGAGRPKPGPGVVPDGFYKDMVWNLRNGVVAITRDGRVAVMNDIAYRVLGLKPRAARHRAPFHARSSRTCPTSRASSPARSSSRTCPTAPSCG